MSLAVVWHFWIAVVLVLTLVVPAVIAVIALYLKNVVGPRYPGKQHRQAS